MFGSPGGTPMSTLYACTEEHACVIRTEPSSETARKRKGTAGREEEVVRMRIKPREEGVGEGREETRVVEDMKEDRKPDHGPAQKNRKAEEKSRESRKASHVPGGTWL
ncbi:hypothetical protein NDU88_001631 [Pleurodeles waltl]|uniref:Uncharacterized protein n=1 Tax=Pleurodeles waltl TaxID=8319 RepID=A0AAV7UTB0_PLEWA|nr:hypothetical protein NDU88_001631 [Pleurodeles waltl]